MYYVVQTVEPTRNANESTSEIAMGGYVTVIKDRSCKQLIFK